MIFYRSLVTAEHFTAVIVAGKDKMDLSIAIAVGSSVQIALFAAPAMMLFAWALGPSHPRVWYVRNRSNLRIGIGC